MDENDLTISRVGLEIGIDEAQEVVVMKVSDDEHSIQFALTPEQAYAMAVGMMGALRSLKQSHIPLAVREGETVH